MSVGRAWLRLISTRRFVRRAYAAIILMPSIMISIIAYAFHYAYGMIPIMLILCCQSLLCLIGILLQYSTVQYSTVQYSTVQYSIGWPSESGKIGLREYRRPSHSNTRPDPNLGFCYHFIASPLRRFTSSSTGSLVSLLNSLSLPHCRCQHLYVVHQSRRQPRYSTFFLPRCCRRAVAVNCYFRMNSSEGVSCMLNIAVCKVGVLFGSLEDSQYRGFDDRRDCHGASFVVMCDLLPSKSALPQITIALGLLLLINANGLGGEAFSLPRMIMSSAPSKNHLLLQD